MSGMKKVAGPSAGKGTPPTQSKPQTNNLMSFFAKAPTIKKDTNITSTPTPTPAPSTSSTSSGSTPPRVGFGAAAGADVTAAYFGGAKAPTATPSKMLSAAIAVPKTQTPTHTLTPLKTPVSKPATPSSADSSMGISSSGRKRKTIQYEESDGETGGENDDEDRPVAAMKKTKREKDDEEYGGVPDEDEESDVDGGLSDPASEAEEEKVSKPRTSSASKPKSSVPKPTSSYKKKASPVASNDDGFGDEDDTTGSAPAASSASGKTYSTDFLKPENRRDKQQRRPGAPGYDATTLYIDPKYFKSMTPAEKQYWDIKSNNMDLILFFKIGKFYELFDEDAYIGVEELGLNMMTSQIRPHCGFPEAALEKYAEKLVALGYKVGQVDQTETPEMMKAANSVAGKGAKRNVVDRKISSVLTPGTLVDGEVLGSADANYLFALTERLIPQEEIASAEEQFTLAQQQQNISPKELAKLESACFEVTELGFTWVDCTTGRFTVGQHRDDQQRSFLRTVLGYVAPREVLLPLNGLSKETDFVLKNEVREESFCYATFPSVNDTTRLLHQYYVDPAVIKREGAPTASSITTWPQVLQQLVGEKQDQAMQSFGAVAQYLARTLHDVELLSQRHVSRYYGQQATASSILMLDAQTLANLNVLKNARGKISGTLLEFVDRTSTAFGHRTIRDWLIAPLYDISAIQSRQDAVFFFMKHPELSGTLRASLKSLPDLERNLSRVHANGIKKKVEAIMYGDVGGKQLDVFLKTLEGFDRVNRMLQSFDLIDASTPGFEKGSRLRELVTLQSAGGRLPDFMPELEAVRRLFDVRLAVSEKKIKPTRGTIDEYDACMEGIEQVNEELHSYLQELQKQFKCSAIKWMHKNKERYQIEIPINFTKNVPDAFQQMSSSKTVKRYWTKTSRELSNRLTELATDQENFEKDMARTVFARFAEKFAVWSGVVSVIAELDCLLSLALVAQQHTGCVRPEFVDFVANGKQSMLNLRQASHPALYEREQKDTVAGRMSRISSFVPNDTVIGCEENPARFVLVSGANMGGKSTLLRQTCCAVILAQMGCWVPAEKCQLTPVDRIFTRVGANDKLMQGLSTFHVELLETSVILNLATPRSLVILDELGRGTSTFDGTAIAHAVVKFLSHKKGCATLFATHYHMLMDAFASDPLISMYHMASQVNESETDVTFLYKFIPGVCPKSYGNNVARAAGLSDRVVQRAQQMSEKFEKRCVEAMGRNRSEMAAQFPPQKSDTFALPLSTLEVTNVSLDDDDLDELIRLRLSFDVASKQGATTENIKQKQQFAMEANGQDVIMQE